MAKEQAGKAGNTADRFSANGEARTAAHAVDQTNRRNGGDNSGDGRHIDPALGMLTGEGSHQQHDTARTHPDREPRQVWEQMPTQTQGSRAAAQTAAAEGPTYYDRPVIKEPVWIWTIPLYFFIGGAAGATAVLGAAAQLFGGRRLRELVSRCRWISAIGAIISAVLLIGDLGRPARFLNMLRIFRPTSPMSVGSWILTGFGGLTTLAALFSRRRGLLKGVGDGAGVVSALFGVGLAGYTGVLLSNSVVPLWLATRRSLPVLFMASGMASAAALLDLLPLSRRAATVVRRFGQVGRAAELVAAAVVEREAARVERVGRPLQEGLSGQLWKASKWIGGVGLLLSFLPGNRRGLRIVAALFTIVGSLLLRYGLMAAGKASARDPHATFQQQRSGTQ